MLPSVRFVLGVIRAPSVHHDLYPVEGFPLDDRRLNDFLRLQPLAGVVPTEFGGAAERDVIDVDEHLVFALFVPHLVPRVAGVDQDRPDGELLPRDAAAVPVAGRVVGADGLGMPSRVSPSAMA